MLTFMEGLDICLVRLSGDASNWPAAGGSFSSALEASQCRFFSATRTADEMSLVVDSQLAPAPTAHIKVEGGWIIFRLEGPLDFALVGILARIATTLAKHGVSIFAVSTYDTDYVLLKKESKAVAIKALEADGYCFGTDGLTS